MNNGNRETAPATVLLAYRAAIGLAAIHFPLSEDNGVTLVRGRDVAYMLDGHLDVWPEWPLLSTDDRLMITRLLRLRRSELAAAEVIMRDLQRCLERGEIPGCAVVDDLEGQLTISCTPGMPLRSFALQALEALGKKSATGRGRTSTAPPGNYHSSIRIEQPTLGRTKVVDQRYVIPFYTTSTPAAVPTVHISPEILEIRVPTNELIELAEKIDSHRSDSKPYRARHIRRLCSRLAGKDGMVMLKELLLAVGQLRVLNAPTGIGKSVLMEIVAVWAAAIEKLVITIVVPNNTDVLKLTRAIELDLEAYGGDTTVTALMSPSSTFEMVRKVARTRPAWDPDGTWTFDRLGYGCALAAAAVNDQGVDAWAPGREPCTRLSRTSIDGKGEHAVCPFIHACGKFRLSRAATTANVIVTSHANLHSGRLHIPVRDDRGTTDRMTVEDLVLKRSHLVVIDEVDAFQKAALGEAGRGLLLDRRGSIDTPLHELEREFVTTAGRIQSKVESSVRDMVHHSKYLASEYTQALDDGWISADRPSAPTAAGRYWIIPRRWDGRLTRQLFQVPAEEPLTREKVAAFLSLFPGAYESPAPDEPTELAAVREVLATVTGNGHGGNMLPPARERLDILLKECIPDNADRGLAINRILQRAFLERLRRNLRRFVFDAPYLAAAGATSARDIAETFGPYSRWRALPNGPLGRLLFAFSQHVDPAGRLPTRLNVAAFGGDPHVYTTTLGDITALCHSGKRRAVLGLSATAYFPMAPHHHIHVDPHWWVPDDDPNGVTILPVRLMEAGTDKHRLQKVSGKEGRNRHAALRTLASTLWKTRLSTELERLKAEDPDRARILLATTSYDSVGKIAEGLVAAGVDPRRICAAIRPTGRRDIGDQPSAPGETNWWELPADRLEEFPAIAEADILIAVLARVQRGVNIIGKGDQSALGSIWLLVRPVPVIDEPSELIAHINAHVLTDDPTDKLMAGLPLRKPSEILDARKQAAGYYLEEIVTSCPYFRTMPKAVQLAITAEIMNGIVQLVGRARRGGTPATIHLVDGAFHDPDTGPTFGTLILKLREHWRQTAVLDRMQQLYGTTLQAFFTYAESEAQTLTP